MCSLPHSRRGIMPRRPDSHVIADIAVGHVTEICNRCGWASEVVKKDYGEDLLVQPSFGGVVDHNRIWIQVKGTRSLDRFRTRSHGLSLMVSLDQALRWVRSAEMVIVVLWDVEREVGLWSIPQQDLHEWNLVAFKQRKTRLLFTEEKVFDVSSVARLGWRARMDHYANLLTRALDEDYQNSCLAEETQAVKGDSQSRIPLIAFDFLKRVGVLDENSFSFAFFEQLYECGQIHKARSEDPGDGRSLILLAFLRHLAVLSDNCPVPNRLAEHCYDLICSLVDALGVKIHLRSLSD
jgi:hypothetical protein